MMPQNLPPRIATWLVNLFATGEEAESILGDLLEEFSDLASRTGAAVARRWYWRQTMKTIAHLIGIGFRTAPWAIVAAVIVGFLVNPFVVWLLEGTITAVLARYFVFFAIFYGFAIGHVIASLFVGCMVALVARNKEMVATTTLVLVFFTMTAAALPRWIATRHTHILFLLAWNFSDWLAIMAGGAIVRMRRSATSRSSHA